MGDLMIEPTSSSPGSEHVTLREFEAFQKAISNEQILRQGALEQARAALEKLVDAKYAEIQKALSLALDNHEKEHAVLFQDVIRERGLLMDSVATMRKAELEAHQREHAASLIYINKAEESVNKRLEAMNELRAQIATERGDYVRSDTYAVRMDELINRVTLMEQSYIALKGDVAVMSGLTGRVHDLEAIMANAQGRMAMMGAVITIIISIVVIVANFITKFL